MIEAVLLAIHLEKWPGLAWIIIEQVGAVSHLMDIDAKFRGGSAGNGVAYDTNDAASKFNHHQHS